MEYLKDSENEQRDKESIDRLEFLAELEEKMYASLFINGTNKEESFIQKRYAEYYALCIYIGSKHFVEVSRDMHHIANVLRVTPQMVHWLSKMPAWEDAIRFWGYTGDRRLCRPSPLVNVPLTLREGYLIQDVFQKYCPIRFVTYDGFRDVYVKKVVTYKFLLEDDSLLNKHDIILAFPQDRMVYVKKGIKRRRSIAEKNLKPIISRKDRPKINTAARIGNQIECVMRNGLVVTGENVWISRYNIVIRVGGKKGEGGKIVLLYRHALYSFNVLSTQSEVSDTFNDIFDDEEGHNAVAFR